MTEQKTEEKIVLGLYEKVKVITKDKTESEEHISRIDTGATRSSIDLILAGKYNLGPILRTKLVKNAHGKKLRPII